MKKNLEVDIVIPLVPNFISYGERKNLPISAFTDDELEEIGKQWTANLIARAKQQRKK